MRMERPFLAQESGCRLERWKKCVISGSSTFLPKYDKAYVHEYHRPYRLHQIAMLYPAQEPAHLFSIFEALYRVVFALPVYVCKHTHTSNFIDRAPK